jgi:hypothetical protein
MTKAKKGQVDEAAVEKVNAFELNSKKIYDFLGALSPLERGHLIDTLNTVIGLDLIVNSGAITPEHIVSSFELKDQSQLGLFLKGGLGFTSKDLTVINTVVDAINRQRSGQQTQ